MGFQIQPIFKNGIFIIGGGLSGLSTGLYLAKRGVKITLMEKKFYPFHRVCGEYISNEVLPFLSELGVNPFQSGASKINKLEITSVQGRVLSQSLDLGGFGISRFALDRILYQELVKTGAEVLQGEKINAVEFKNPHFILQDSQGRAFLVDHVIGAFGKRSNLDQVLNRPFFKKRSPFLGVKYHLKLEMPDDLIQLHNFKDGYAGISAIENKTYCFCYLTKSSNLKPYTSIAEMEGAILNKNPFLKNIFDQAEFLWEKPQIINEISFEPKEPIYNHIFMSGDAAGLISPLCGNGMAIAIHSGKILAEAILEAGEGGLTGKGRDKLEETYRNRWKNNFRFRLWVGRQIQSLFGNDRVTDRTLQFLNHTPKLLRTIINNTHGKEF